MLDPLLTLLALKAKAVGLVAGTALVTTAVVGGGATVAFQAVSNETDAGGVVAEQSDADLPDDGLDGGTAPDLGEGTEGLDDGVLEDTEAIEGTDTTDTTEVPDLDDVSDELDPVEDAAPALPADFKCDDALNHGQNVSAYAKSLPKGPGRGELVSAVAQSDCGKKAAEDEAEAEVVVPETPAEADEQAPEPTVETQAEPAPKAEEKAEKAAAKSEKKAEKPAKAGPPAGKGGGKK